MKPRRAARYYEADEFNVDAETYLAREVIDDYELIDTGVLDSDGEKIMARKKMKIGFIHWPEKE